MHDESINDLPIATRAPIRLNWGLFLLIGLMIIAIIAFSLLAFH